MFAGVSCVLLPSEEGITSKVLKDFYMKAKARFPRPKSGLDCLICAIFARLRLTQVSFSLANDDPTAAL